MKFHHACTKNLILEKSGHYVCDKCCLEVKKGGLVLYTCQPRFSVIKCLSINNKVWTESGDYFIGQAYLTEVCNNSRSVHLREQIKEQKEILGSERESTGENYEGSTLSLASPQTSFEVRLSRIHFSQTNPKGHLRGGYPKAGFVQSLKLLKNSWQFAQQFSRPRKSLENKDKVWKKSGVLFFSKPRQMLYSK